MFRTALKAPDVCTKLLSDTTIEFPLKEPSYIPECFNKHLMVDLLNFYIM